MAYLYILAYFNSRDYFFCVRTLIRLDHTVFITISHYLHLCEMVCVKKVSKINIMILLMKFEDTVFKGIET
jgi:hypothetical protein